MLGPYPGGDSGSEGGDWYPSDDESIVGTYPGVGDGDVSGPYSSDDVCGPYPGEDAYSNPRRSLAGARLLLHGLQHQSMEWSGGRSADAFFEWPGRKLDVAP